MRRSKEDLTIMLEPIATGEVTPVIDKRYKLSKVPDVSGTWKQHTLEEK